MTFLNEDGSLNIERINSLPIEEYMEVMGDLTQEQVQEYLSKSPINESNEPMRGIKINYRLQEDLDGGCIDADVLLNNLREELKRKNGNQII